MTRFDTLRRADELYGLPEYVKSAAAIDESIAEAEENELVDTAFADSCERQFPVHNKVAAYLSAVKFAEQRLAEAAEDDVQVVKNIFDAAERFGVLDDVTAVLGKAADQAIKSSAAIKYAIDDQKENLKLFRVDTPEAAINSLGEFYGARYQLPLAHRKSAAAAILNGINGQSVSSSLDPARIYATKLANANPVCSGSSAASACWTRAEMLRKIDPDAYTMMDKLAHTLATRETVSGDEVHQLLEDLEKVDLMSGLYNQYGRSMRLPEEIMLAEDIVGTKSASEKTEDKIFLSCGLVVPVEVISRCGFNPFNFAGIPEKAAADTQGNFDIRSATEVLKLASPTTSSKYVQAIQADSGPGRQKIASTNRRVLDLDTLTSTTVNDGIFNFKTP